MSDDTIINLTTGNIFVDQAQLTILALLGKNYEDTLTVKDVKSLKENNELYGIKWLSQNLPKFKSSFMLLVNSLRLNPSNKVSEEEKIALYHGFLELLIDEIENQFSKKNKEKSKEKICDVCGSFFCFNFQERVTEIQKEHKKSYTKKDEEKLKFPCRDYFPLMGSMGSESQSFSNMSFVPEICPRCLFAINYLPYSSVVIEGSLGIFQFSEQKVQYEVTKNLVREYIETIEVSNEKNKIETKGKDSRYKSKNMIIIEIIKTYYQKALPENPSKEDILHNFPKRSFFAWLWKYSNSGQKAELFMEHVPNEAFSFLYMLHIFGDLQKLEEMVNQESKKIKHPSKQFYNSLKYKRLYQFEKHENEYQTIGTSILFSYYYFILGLNKKQIEGYLKIAERILASYTKENLKKEFRNRFLIIINQIVRDLVKEKALTLNDILSMFSFSVDEDNIQGYSIIRQLIDISVEREKWEEYKEMLELYLPQEFQEKETETIEISLVNRNILYLLSEIFLYQIERYLDKKEFEERVINLYLKRRNTNWFNTVFARLIQNKNKDLNYVDFKYLLNKTGNWNRLRTIMMPVFTYWVQTDYSSNVYNYSPPSQLYQEKTVNYLINQVLSTYLDLRIKLKGESYMKRNFLNPLLADRLKLSHLRFLLDAKKEEIEFSEEMWEKMLIDTETGVQNSNTFFMQIKIFAANYFSNELWKKEAVKEENNTITDQI